MDRQIIIKTPLGKDALLLVSMHGQEELGRLYQYTLELYSRDEAIDVAKILGQKVTVTLALGEGKERFINGYISDFSQIGSARSEYTAYHATLRPWLWFLSRTSDCRMFQDESVPDIVKKVFSDNGFSDFEIKLSGTYSPWEYCVQYRETDLQFVSRLLEQEGIYYFFRHQDGKHILVLTDSVSGHKKIRADAFPYNNTDVDREDQISDWRIHHELQPGALALNDYDFKVPNKNLKTQARVARDHAHADHEIFDYPGEYVQKGPDAKGEAEARNRVEALHVDYERLEGQTNARDFCVGGLFTLEGHSRDDQNREYLLVSASYMVSSEQFTSGQGGSGPTYSCSLEAIPGKTPFRSGHTTSKPVVQGPQAAVIVDDQPDEYGRVKVQFYWDREEQASCWVRVSQNSAGDGWGSMFVPHIGHEVLVSFYEGDPDRPIITGKVYNADNMPPGEWSGDTRNSVVTDHGGNHIVMTGDSGSEKIEIRDKHCNEIVLDAVEGTIRIYSPSHESEMVLGRSVKIESLSDYSLNFGGDKFQKIMGKTKVEYGADVANFYAGAKNSVFVGINNSAQLAATFSEFVGIKTSVSKALLVSKNYDKKVFIDKKVNRTAETHVTEKSPKIEYAAEKSKVMLDAKRALLMSGKSQIMLKKDADVTLNSNSNVEVNAKKKILLNAKSGAVQIKSGKGIALQCPGKNIVLHGKKIQIG